jgi:hypothetical protein
MMPKCRWGELVPADAEGPSIVQWCDRWRWHLGGHRLGEPFTLDRQPRKVRPDSPLAMQRLWDSLHGR